MQFMKNLHFAPKFSIAFKLPLAVKMHSLRDMGPTLGNTGLGG